MSETRVDAAPRPEANRYLTFRLDEEIFGVPILEVREIIELQEISPVPRTMPWVRGVVNLRGRVLPVIDPKIRFGLAPVEPSELTVIVVLKAQDASPFGVLVDEVLEVQRLDPEAISETPVTGEAGEFVTGVGKLRDALLFILDPNVLAVQ
ncbi:MAG: chemotaxis protein CheW [Myxococcota bacterium]